MSEVLTYALVGGSVLALLGAIALIRAVAKSYGWSAEVQRKAVHVMVGLYALCLPLVFTASLPAVLLIVIAIAVMIGLRSARGKLGEISAAIHSVERRSYGDIWLVIAVGFLFLSSGGSYILYGLPLAMITLSDAAAALTGSVYGRRRFITEGGVKSWEGIIAFTTVGWIVAMIMLLLFSDTGREEVIVLGLVVAVFGAMVEAVSWRGLDNLFVPLAIFFYLQGFLHADVLTICLAASFFMVTTAIAQAAAGKLKLAPQTARAFAVALFIIVGVGDPFGAVMPLLAIAAFLISRPRIQPEGAHPELDFLATVCGGAAMWLFVGEMLGPSAIHYYSLAFAGLFMAYALMGLQASGYRWWQLPFIAASYALTLGLSQSGLEQLPMPTNYPIVVGLSFGFVALILWLTPQSFVRWRAPKTLALASVVPSLAYAYQVISS